MKKWSKEQKNTIKFAKQKNSLLHIALDELSLGKVSLYRVLNGNPNEIDVSLSYVNSALENLRKSNQQDHIPIGLFCHTDLCIITKDFKQAWANLEEVHDIVFPSCMVLFQSIYHLTVSKLLIAQYYMKSYRIINNGKVEEMDDNKIIENILSHIKSAEKLITDTNFNLKLPEVYMLYSHYFTIIGNRELAFLNIRKAKDLTRKMNIKLLNFEIKEIENKLR